MIVRSWSARATPGSLDAYLAHLRERVLPELRGIDGYRRAEVLRRDLPGAGLVEIVVLTWWGSWEAIRQFAGDDLERAVVEDVAARILTEFDDRVTHYEVALDDQR